VPYQRLSPGFIRRDRTLAARRHSNRFRVRLSEFPRRTLASFPRCQFWALCRRGSTCGVLPLHVAGPVHRSATLKASWSSGCVPLTRMDVAWRATVATDHLGDSSFPLWTHFGKWLSASFRATVSFRHAGLSTRLASFREVRVTSEFPDFSYLYHTCTEIQHTISSSRLHAIGTASGGSLIRVAS